MTELLEQPSLADEQRLAYADKIDTQVTRITWLIRHLLTLSQLEAGVLAMKREEVSLADVIEQVRDSLGVLAELRNVEIPADIPGEIVMKGDRHWLCEAIMNIVKNGIEHNERQSGGYVRIRAEQTPLFIRLTMEDNGSGIDEADLPHIFERFYKAKNAPTQSIGIGLALARQIIAGHNGRIDVESVRGQGSVFTVTFYGVSAG
jgi:signal transduction histidine kinase